MIDLTAFLGRLLEWERLLGGWEAPVWDEVRSLHQRAKAGQVSLVESCASSEMIGALATVLCERCDDPEATERNVRAWLDRLEDDGLVWDNHLGPMVDRLERQWFGRDRRADPD